MVNLHAQYQRDDHDNPSFLFLPGGQRMAFYTLLGGGAVHSRTTVRPGDFSEWTPEVALPLNERAGVTYRNPHMLSDENNTIYLFFRGRGTKPNRSNGSL